MFGFARFVGIKYVRSLEYRFTLLETLDFSAEIPADFGKLSAGNGFPAEFAKDSGSQLIPQSLWVTVS